MRDLTSSNLIITGGYKTKHTVSRYDSQGFVEDLPSLVKGRSKHGCASYLREDGTQVGGLYYSFMHTGFIGPTCRGRGQWWLFERSRGIY